MPPLQEISPPSPLMLSSRKVPVVFAPPPIPSSHPPRDRTLSTDSSRTSSSGSNQSSTRSLEIRISKLMKKYGRYHTRLGQAWNVLGIHHFRNSNHQQATEAFKQAVMCERGVHTATAFLNLGTISWNTGDIDEAIRFLKQALGMYRLEPVEQTAEIANATHQLGLCYALQNDYHQALQCLADAMHIHERHNDSVKIGVSLNAIGKVYLMAGDLSKAIEIFMQALRVLNEARASTTNVLFNLAKCYLQQNGYRSAVLYLKQLLHQIEPDDKAMLLPTYEMAEEAHRALGQTNEAQKCRAMIDKLQYN